MRRLRTLKLALAALILTAAAGGDALAQATIDVIAPDVQQVDQQFLVSFNYALEGGTWDDFVLQMAIPEGVTLVQSSHPVTLDHACSGTAPNVVCTWSTDSLAVANTGVSGTIQLTMRLDRWAHPDGSEVALSGALGASYTDNGGASQSVVIGPDVEPIEADASANLQWHDHRVTGAEARWIPHPVTGESGYYYIYDFRWRNVGTAPLEIGAVLTVELAPDVVFVDAWEQCNNSVLPKSECGDMTVSHALTPWQPAGAGATLTGTMTRVMGRNVNGHDYSPHLQVAVWVPCSAIPTGTGVAAYASRASVVAEELTADATIDWTLDPNPDLDPPGPVTHDPACGTGEIISKSHYARQGVGVPHGWNLNVTAPKGQLAFDDVVIIDKIPEDTTLDTWHDIRSEDFTAYSCDLPGVSEDFTAAQFLTYVSDGDCETWDGSPVPDATHAVWYAPTWGGPDGIDDFFVRIWNDVPRDYLSTGGDPVMVNRMKVEAGVVGSEAVAFAGLDQAQHTLREGSHPQTRQASDTRNTDPRVLAPGDVATVVIGSYWDVNYQRPENYTVRIDVDPRVEVLSFETEFRDIAHCQEWEPEAGHFTVPAEADNTMIWTYGDAESPAYIENRNWAGCVVEIVTFKVPEEGVFVNGDTITVTAETTAEDQADDYSNVATIGYTLAVPGEMRFEVSPSCQDDGQPGFLAIASNTGGTDLSDLVADVFVPGALPGDPSTASAVFAGIDVAPPGASFQVSADGTSFVAVGSIPDADVQVVRMTHPGLAALADPLTFRVLLSTGDTSGTLHARGYLDAAELEPADSQFSAAFQVNQCPGTLTIAKFWDADLDGEQGAGEASLAGWSFTVSDGETSVVVGPTGDDGLTSVELAPGDYTVTEQLPADSEGTWVTPVGGFARDVTVAPAGDPVVTFGNACACTDPVPGDCTGVVCDVDGSCVDAALDGTSCDDGEVCTDGDVCVAGACTAGDPLDCGDGDSCTTDVCVDGVGCESVGPGCEEVEYGLLVTDATGDIAGVARCMASAGGPPVCDNVDGELTVYAPGSQGYDPTLFQCVTPVNQAK